MFRHTAHLYDALYEAAGKDYAQESADIHDLIEHRGPGARTLLDVACGTGGHLQYLRRWYAVTGVDVDPGMLAEARAKLPTVSLIEADMRSLALGQTFDAAVCLFSSIGYMRSTDEMDVAISAIARHLVPGGVLVVDGWVRPDAWINGGTTTVETAHTEDATVVRVSRSVRDGERTSLEMHHLVATAAGIEHLVDHHDLTLFAPDDYEAAFRAAGLTVDIVPCPLPGRDRYVATKAPGDRPVSPAGPGAPPPHR
ncbi:MAG TPA: class I SAM-dependent methyltransferase [Acidimicrobiales bacterium]|nr:class I SAM-dependent methyltransferase [Acidimicrobiales bacterium]